MKLKQKSLWRKIVVRKKKSEYQKMNDKDTEEKQITDNISFV